jgi:hypothetical protein
MILDRIKRATVPVLAVLTAAVSFAQSSTFAGNSQHTSLYTPAAQKLNAIKWQATHELSASGAFAHYGPPLISASNVFFQPVHTAANGFKVEARNTSDGSLRFSVDSDYVLPGYNWIPTFNLVLTTGPGSTPRLYYPGAGGTLWYIDNPDTVTSPTPVRVAFQGSGYASNSSGFNSSVFINTPLTADASGNVYFGFRTQGTAPSPVSSAYSGIAKVTAAGTGSWVLVNAMTSDNNVTRTQHNAAPALSNDEQTLYVTARGNSQAYGYLVALNPSTLDTRSKVFLRDPRPVGILFNNAFLLDDSTASPLVAPDGDVFIGVMGNPFNGSRGWLLHFSGDLSTQFTPGAFGWDQTPGIVPASMVPQYTGPSSYLLFSKYNNYAIGDGNGINQVAILDPKTTQTDPHSSAGGLSVMREVLTMNGPTPDAEYPSVPNAVREWCINTAVVNPATGEVFFDSEDGHIYAWNLAKNSLTQSVMLTSGIGEPYVPSVLGPDGTVYTLNGTFTFALGLKDTANLSLVSSKPSSQTVVAGDSITFGVKVTGDGTPFTGTIQLEDISVSAFTRQSAPLATLTLNASGQATYTTSALSANSDNLGNHWIKATLKNDSHYPEISSMLVQKIHRTRTMTNLTSSAAPATFGALGLGVTVVPQASGMPYPGGMVTLRDGNAVIDQKALSNGSTTFNLKTLPVGSHLLSVSYYGDTVCASSMRSITQLVQSNTSTVLEIVNNPTGYRVPTALRATVTAAAAGAGAPKGRVNFKRDGVLIGAAMVDGSGVATLNTTGLAVGSGQVTAEFVGQTGWIASTSAPVTLTVTQMTRLQLVLAAVRSGQSFSVNVTLADTNGATVKLTSDLAGFTLPDVVVPAGSSTGSVTVNAPLVSTTTLINITAKLNGQTLTALERVLPVSLNAVSLDPASVVSGSSSTGTVTLNGKAPSGGVVVNLSSSSAAAGVPANVTVLEGNDSATFTVTTSAAYMLKLATITANLGTDNRTAKLTIKAQIGVSSVTFNPARPFEGESTTGTVTLNQPAGAGGQMVNLSEVGTSVLTFPATVTVPEGATSTTFAVSVPVLTSTGAPYMTIRAAANGTQVDGTFRVLPNAVLSVTLDAPTVIGGENTNGTVTLTRPAPAGGLTINLSASNTWASVPATVFIPEGDTTADFVISTRVRTTNMNVTISAARNGVTKTVLLTITP